MTFKQNPLLLLAPIDSGPCHHSHYRYRFPSAIMNYFVWMPFALVITKIECRLRSLFTQSLHSSIVCFIFGFHKKISSFLLFLSTVLFRFPFPFQLPQPFSSTTSFSPISPLCAFIVHHSRIHAFTIFYSFGVHLSFIIDYLFSFCLCIRSTCCVYRGEF